MEYFHEILEEGIIKVFLANRDDLNEMIPLVLWTYQTTTNNLHKHTPFMLVIYGQKVVVLA